MTGLPEGLAEHLARALGSPPLRATPLGGGCIAPVYRTDLADGRQAVVKLAPDTAALEARMLRYLAAHSDLPLPAVLYEADGGGRNILVLAYVESDGSRAEADAARLLAELHDVGAPAYGLDFDTLIGPLPQENTWSDDWPGFFRDRRLLPMTQRALESGNLSRETGRALDRVAGRLDDLLRPANPPGLVHGDIWSGNVLTRSGRIAAFLDPAVHYADPEVELAFIAMFATFGARFFADYAARRPLSDDFETVRKPIYQLYPLLVHATLFGGGYVTAVDRIARRFA